MVARADVSRRHGATHPHLPFCRLPVVRADLRRARACYCDLTTFWPTLFLDGTLCNHRRTARHVPAAVANAVAGLNGGLRCARLPRTGRRCRAVSHLHTAAAYAATYHFRQRICLLACTRAHLPQPLWRRAAQQRRALRTPHALHSCGIYAQHLNIKAHLRAICVFAYFDRYDAPFAFSRCRCARTRDTLLHIALRTAARCGAPRYRAFLASRACLPRTHRAPFATISRRHAAAYINSFAAPLPPAAALHRRTFAYYRTHRCHSTAPSACTHMPATAAPTTPPTACGRRRIPTLSSIAPTL